MTTTARPFGMLPIKKVGGKPYNGSFSHYNIKNSTTGNLFLGDPVRLSSGFVVLVTVAGGALDNALGVFMGCMYVDPNSSQPTWKPAYIAPVSSKGVMEGRPNPIAIVSDDPDTIYKVQANASVTTQDVGLNFLVTVSAGNTTFGTSRAHLEAGSRVSSAGFVKMVGIYDIPGNTFSNENTADLYPIVEVVFNNHQLRTALTSVA